MNSFKNNIGYVKYVGSRVEDGIMGAKESAEALLGFDQLVRYLLENDIPELKNENFSIPVQVKKGSWEIKIFDYLMDNYGEILDIIKIAAGIGLSRGILAYSKKMGEVAAQDGLLKSGTGKDLATCMKKTITAIKWFFRIGKFRGTLNKETLKDEVSLNMKDETALLKITDKGELIVPLEFFTLFEKLPAKLLEKISSLIEENRGLEIGLDEPGDIPETVTFTDRHIFYSGVDTEEELRVLPELEHGDWVELIGGITRVNESKNNFGFAYNGHVLTCKPLKGNIVSFKHNIVASDSNLFYPEVKVVGEVHRKDVHGKDKEKKPQIRFDQIIPTVDTEEPSQQRDLFRL